MRPTSDRTENWSQKQFIKQFIKTFKLRDSSVPHSAVPYIWLVDHIGAIEIEKDRAHSAQLQIERLPECIDRVCVRFWSAANMAASQIESHGSQPSFLARLHFGTFHV
jgi:hypothetical protein